MAMEFTFRQAHSEDLERVVAMMRELYSSDDLGFPARGPVALELLVDQPALGCCEIICDGQDPIGYFVLGFGFSLEFGGRDAFLDELYVAQSARGKGAGRAAVARATEICRNLGIHALHLEVNSENTTAQRLYRRAGFTSRHSGYDLLTLRLDQTTDDSLRTGHQQ